MKKNKAQKNKREENNYKLSAYVGTEHAGAGFIEAEYDPYENAVILRDSDQVEIWLDTDEFGNFAKDIYDFCKRLEALRKPTTPPKDNTSEWEVQFDAEFAPESIWVVPSDDNRATILAIKDFIAQLLEKERKKEEKTIKECAVCGREGSDYCDNCFEAIVIETAQED